MIRWFKNLIYGKCTEQFNAELEDMKQYKSKVEYFAQKTEALEASVRALSTEANQCKMESLKCGSKQVYHFLEDPIIYDEPVKIKSEEIYKIMNQYGCQVMTPLDSYSYGIDLDDVMTIVRRNYQIRDTKYVAETMDCDDFAIAMWGLFNQRNLARFAFGWARSAGHAFNFFVDRNKNVWVIEPQGTSFMTISEAMNNKDYKITQYII